MTSKEGLQNIIGSDPIVVVKTPVFYRRRLPEVGLHADCLRSAWVLVNGHSEQTEDRAHPVEQQDRFQRWIERACFQFHRPDQSHSSSRQSGKFPAPVGEDP